LASPKAGGKLKAGRTGRPPADVTSDSFGGRLRAARIKKGYKSAQAFADAMQVERPTVNRWEGNIVAPPNYAIARINQLLGTNFTRPAIDKTKKEVSRDLSPLLLPKGLVEMLDEAARQSPRKLTRDQVGSEIITKFLPTWKADEHLGLSADSTRPENNSESRLNPGVYPHIVPHPSSPRTAEEGGPGTRPEITARTQSPTHGRERRTKDR